MLVRRWSDVGQTLVRRWSDVGLLGRAGLHLERVGELRRHRGAARLVVVAQVGDGVLVRGHQEDVNVEVDGVVSERVGEADGHLRHTSQPWRDQPWHIDVGGGGCAC
eukprot:1829358-Prymnesium_polylepis.1